MAITRGVASGGAAQTVANATWTDILPSGYKGCEAIQIDCSAQGVFVAVEQRAGAGDSVHGAISGNTPTAYYDLAADASTVFYGSQENKITRVMVAGNGGTATITWTVVKA